MISGSATPPAAGRSERPACVRILLVDDHEGVRNATAMLLRTEGFEVLSVASLSDAREALRTGSPIDLVITDYRLQNGATGIDVIAMARSVAGEQLGAVLVSGDTSALPPDVQTTGRLRLAGKPVRARELLGLVTELLSVRNDGQTVSAAAPGAAAGTAPAAAAATAAPAPFPATSCPSREPSR